MNIPRALTGQILDKITLLYGPRQVGKTTLARQIIDQIGLKTLSINADQQKYVDVLSSRDFEKIRSLIAGYDLLFLDEAQKIPDVGLNLKIMTDEAPSLKIIATGSSSFDLANKVSEPLTGRCWTYHLYPVGFCELKMLRNPFELHSKLEGALIYGGYPEVVTTINVKQKQELLEEICRAYLYKDVLELATIKHAGQLRKLLKLLAFQIGSEVSMHELSNTLNLNRETVERYLDLLEKAFVIFRVGAFSRNLRKEVSKMDKIYFYDVGIRNAVIDHFKPLADRDDVGKLWENFLIVERQKFLSYQNEYATSYFWRTHTGAELDYVEDRGGKLYGYEFKYTTSKARMPKSWLGTYKNSSFETVHKENYLRFIAGVSTGPTK